MFGYQNVQVWGIRGCNLLKEYVCGAERGGNAGTGSQEYLMSVVVNGNAMQGARLHTVGQLGTVRTFNYKTQ